jgi:hypothetical protein
MSRPPTRRHRTLAARCPARIGVTGSSTRRGVPDRRVSGALSGVEARWLLHSASATDCPNRAPVACPTASTKRRRTRSADRCSAWLPTWCPLHLEDVRAEPDAPIADVDTGPSDQFLDPAEPMAAAPAAERAPQRAVHPLRPPTTHKHATSLKAVSLRAGMPTIAGTERPPPGARGHPTPLVPSGSHAASNYCHPASASLALRTAAAVACLSAGSMGLPAGS